MRTKIILSLFLLVFISGMSVLLIELISEDDQSSQANFLPTLQATRSTLAPFQLLSQALPSLTPTLDFTQYRNCVYTYYFWRDHPEGWPDKVEIAGVQITKDQAVHFMQAPSTDLILDLQRVLYVTYLNINSGADRGPIDKTIQDVMDWLAFNSPGVPVSEFAQSTTANFMHSLEDYNNGLVGPELCSNQPKTPTPTGTALIQVQGTVDIPSTATATPQPNTPTPTPTNTPRPRQTQRAATPAPRPPSPEEPTNPPLTPTNTQQPPSLTPIPPTSTPSPVPEIDTPIPVTPDTPTPVPPRDTPTPEPTTGTLGP